MKQIDDLLLFLLAALISLFANPRPAEAGPAAAASPQQRNDALIKAVEAGDAPYVRQLLREGADPNSRLLWQRATNMDEYEPATSPVLYLALGWRPGNPGCYNAIVGLSHRLIDAPREIVAGLIRAGADVNVTGDNWLSPLSFAVRHNSTAIVKVLLDAGATIAQVPDHLSLLHEAAANYCDETAELLLRRGVDPNIKDDRGRTPLHWAVVPTLWASERQENQIRFVRVLLKYGADPLVYDKEKSTPLGAALLGNAEVLRLLLFAEKRNR